MPAVSLIIPMYNVEQYLERCISSIAAQTFTDFEAIFVNDGSPDNSAEICQRMIAPYPNMRMVSKPNGGLSSARQYGFHESCGEYISFVDSDDYLAPDYLKTLYEAIIIHNADISMCGYFTDNGKQKVERKLYFKDEVTVLEQGSILLDFLLPQIPSACPNDKLPSLIWLRMFKKSLISDDAFISEKKVCFEDLAFSLILFNNIKRIVAVNTPHYYYCFNYGSLTLRYRENAWDMMLSLYELIVEKLNSVNNSLAHNYIRDFIFYAVLFTLRNASLKGFSQFWKSTRQIMTNVDVCNVIKDTPLTKLHRQNRILAICYHTSTIPFLYLYYKRKL